MGFANVYEQEVLQQAQKLAAQLGGGKIDLVVDPADIGGMKVILHQHGGGQVEIPVNDLLKAGGPPHTAKPTIDTPNDPFAAVKKPAAADLVGTGIVTSFTCTQWPTQGFLTALKEPLKSQMSFEDFFDQSMTPPPPPPPEPAPPAQPPLTVSQPTIGFLSYDEHGFAIQPGEHIPEAPAFNEALAGLIRHIHKATGKVAGRGYSLMPKAHKQDWVTAWYSGDLKTCYTIEATYAKNPSEAHPGHPANPATHHIIWAPQVAGEMPAGMLPDGDWPSPGNLPVGNAKHIHNYLIAARMAHPGHLGSSTRRRWVLAHLSGDKITVDRYSQHAKNRHDDGLPALNPEPTWHDLDGAPLPSYPEHIAAGDSTSMWSLNALRAYCADHQLTCHDAWKALCAAVTAHRSAVAIEEAKAAALPKLEYLPVQPKLAGYHRKHVLVDQHGRRWLFKPAPAEGKRFRPETEHAAHVLARTWGYPTAESRLVEFDGMYGQIQLMFDEAHHLGRHTAKDFATLTTAQLIAVACEHLLDWAIDNDDSHGENIIITTGGLAVGIDKARAWCHFGAWDGLSSHDSANSNARLVYTELYKAIKDGHLPQPVADQCYQAVITRARRMQRLPDTLLADIIAAAVANRPHFNPPPYSPPHPGAPTNAAGLIAAATARKANLVADMTALWERVYTGAGWQLPDPHVSPLGDNAQGYTMHSGLHSPELHRAVTLTKSYGTPTFVAGEDIEDAHILLWREKHAATYRVRGQFKIRPGGAYSAVKSWCAKRCAPGDATAPTAPGLPGEAAAYDAIINAAKTISYHREDGEYNTGKLKALAKAKTELQLRLEVNRGLAPGKHSMQDAIVEYCTRYLGYIDTIEACKAAKGRTTEGDFPRHTYTPASPPEPEPKPEPAKVRMLPASRAAAHKSHEPAFDTDGELALDGTLLENKPYGQWGQIGRMYLVTLPTGEEIEFRGGDDTGTPLALQGQVQFTIPDQATTAESLHRIAGQLATMGIGITGAGPLDLELYYWRHLHAVMCNRRDGQKGASHKYQPFWAALPAGSGNLPPDGEVTAWRTAFATLTSPEHIGEFIATGGHLPRFMHMDLRNPTQPSGKPYWERFDVPDSQWHAKQMPTLAYRNGPKFVVATGVAMATEARIRTFAIWKPGCSSTDDMAYGSSAYVFTRNNQIEESAGSNVFFSPRIARRTTTYSYGTDHYGRICQRPTNAYFEFNKMTSYTDSSNEMMVKDAVSLLDDIEILIFNTETLRADAIAHLATLGITQIRGVPVSVRFIVRGDAAAKAKAMTAAKGSYTTEHGGAGHPAH